MHEHIGGAHEPVADEVHIPRGLSGLINHLEDEPQATSGLETPSIGGLMVDPLIDGSCMLGAARDPRLIEGVIEGFHAGDFDTHMYHLSGF